MHALNRLVALAVPIALGLSAQAQQIATRAQLDAILDGDLLLEEFEGVSLAGGTTVTCANPLNSATAPANWGIIAGASYSSPDPLRLHAGFLHGDSSNILQSVLVITTTFAQPQAAVGLDVVNTTGNVPFTDTVTFYHNSTVLGVLTFPLTAPGDAFAGWQNTAVGITSIKVTSTFFAEIDNIGWGTVVPPAPCYANCDGSTVAPVLNVSDFTCFLNRFAAGNPAANCDGSTTPPVLNVNDFICFQTAYAAGCP